MNDGNKDEDRIVKSRGRYVRRMANISEKIREARREWLVHVEIKTYEDVVM